MILAGAVILEAVVRIRRPRQPGRIGSALANLVPIAILIAGAGGLGLLIGGSSPRESLHLLYGALAFTAPPLAGALSRNSTYRGQATATLLGAVVTLILVARLFQTG